MPIDLVVESAKLQWATELFIPFVGTTDRRRNRQAGFPEEEKLNQDHTFKEMLDIGELQELATASSSQAALTS